MRIFGAIVLGLGLAGCAVAPAAPPAAAPGDRGGFSAGSVAARQFVAVVEAVEPVAEQVCRARTRNVSCDFLIVVDDRRDLPPNAFQTLTEEGRPVVGFTLALIADAQNADELAFVLSHEAAHHIAGHIPQAQRLAAGGATLAGILASMGGASPDGVRAAQNLGATIGVRRFSKEFELEADALGALIATQAGFDALRGADFFSRIPDPGNQFLGSHPPNADRIAIVRRVVEGLETP